MKAERVPDKPAPIEATEQNYLCVRSALYLMTHRIQNRKRGFKNEIEAYEWCFNQKLYSGDPVSLKLIAHFVYLAHFKRLELTQEIVRIAKILEAKK